MVLTFDQIKKVLDARIVSAVDDCTQYLIDFFDKRYYQFENYNFNLSLKVNYYLQLIILQISLSQFVDDCEVG